MPPRGYEFYRERVDGDGDGDKLALINRPWKCKKGKGRRSPLVHSRKLAEHDNFTRAVSRLCQALP